MTPRKRLAWQVAIFASLAALAANLAAVADAGIGFYQAVISPAWDRPCTHARVHGGESCSTHARRLIAERGALPGMTASSRRFAACARLGKGREPR